MSAPLIDFVILAVSKKMTSGIRYLKGLRSSRNDLFSFLLMHSRASERVWRNKEKIIRKKNYTLSKTIEPWKMCVTVKGCKIENDKLSQRIETNFRLLSRKWKHFLRIIDWWITTIRVAHRAYENIHCEANSSFSFQIVTAFIKIHSSYALIIFDTGNIIQ